MTIAIAGCGGTRPMPADSPGPSAGTRPAVASQTARPTRHLEYVFPDEAMYVYDADHRHKLVEHEALPGVTGIRGVAAVPATHRLYISHGGDGGVNGHGSLLAYDLVRRRVVWDRAYATGVDSMAVSRDGSRIYLPDGELSADGAWYVLNAHSGRVIGSIAAGRGAHNTIVALRGGRVYLGGRNSPYLEVASTATNRVIKRIGPLVAGVRPFTITGRETLAYTTATGFLGFQVSSIRTGRVLYTVGFGPRFRWDPRRFASSAPSHGISLSPDERQLWVIDAPNGYVHVFDVSKVPSRPPRRVADIRLMTPLAGSEAGCRYDCARDGWLHHSRDGCRVYVGDSGDVFSTTSFRRAAFLPALRNSRKELEIDWRGGVPVATTSRSGVGYVTTTRTRRLAACTDGRR